MLLLLLLSSSHHPLYYIQVGLGCVTAILNQDICGTIALVDIDAKKLEGEAKGMFQEDLY